MEMKSNMYNYTKWAQKGTSEQSKKIVLNAVDYDAEIVMQTTEPGQEKIKFVDVSKVTIPNTAFLDIAEGLFKRAVNDIAKKSYKAREAAQDTVLCDLAYVGKDFNILRVKSVMVYRDGNYNRLTKIMIHKVNSWDDIREAHKRAMEAKTGSLGFTKDTCIADITLNPYPVIQGNWQDAQDTLVLTAIAKKLESMFLKPTSYGSFLDRVYDNKQSGNESESTSTTTETVGKTVVTADDEFPF